MTDSRGEVLLGLSPTNTGKTHRAIERMLDHDSGMMGLPLRLLAREVYDRVTARVGENRVALVTGEEKRVPADPRYLIATVEAMPADREVDFVAVDEVQLMGNPERGHVFTERVLGARGRKETWLLGARSAEPVLRALIGNAKLVESPRFSALRYIPPTGLGGLPGRSAVVCFSERSVLEMAHRLRHKKGGAAVVLGAFSPRVRNAQVALYQAGEVSHIVATDAIGMGLNLDLDHVAFAETGKFDGTRHRELELGELSQIAGRAGRHLRDGTFGTLRGGPALPPSVTRAIEEHRLAPLEQAYYREAALDYGSAEALLASLATPPRSRVLKRVKPPDDERAFAALSQRDPIARRLTTPDEVLRLWQVCALPDYKKLLFEEHLATLEEIYGMLCGGGAIAPEWFDRRLRKAERTSNELADLMFALADLRTLIYAANQSGWVRDAAHFQGRGRVAEEELSDRLQRELVARFVPVSRVSREVVVPKANPSSPFSVLADLYGRVGEGPARGERPDPVESAIDATDAALSLDARGVIRFEELPLGRLIAGKELGAPDVQVTVEVSAGQRLRLQRRLTAYARDVRSGLPGLPTTEGSAALRGIGYELGRHLGTALAAPLREQIAALSEQDHALIERYGVRIGRRFVLVTRAQKPEVMALRCAFVSAWLGHPPRARLPTGREASVPSAGLPDRRLWIALGYPAFGPRAIRVDVLEKVLADAELLPERVGARLGCKLREAHAVIDALTAERAAHEEPV